MIVLMFLLTACVVGVMLGIWQDLQRQIDSTMNDLLDELRFNPDHALQVEDNDDDDDVEFNLDFTVHANEFDE